MQKPVYVDTVDSSRPIDQDLFRKLKNLIIARLIIGSTLLIGTAIPLEVTGLYSTSRFFFGLVISILVLTIIYAGLLNVMRNLWLLAYFQIVGDILIATVVLTASGGLESPFSILYVLSIIVASYLLPKRGAFVTAFISSVVFGGFILCQYKGWTAWWPVESSWVLLPPPSFAVYIIFVNIAGYYLTAFLANNLSARLQKMDILLKNRTVQYSYLWTLNKRIINEIPTGLLITTQDGFIISMNPAADRFLNIDLQSESKSHLNQVFPGYLVQSMLQIADSDRRGKKQVQYQLEIDRESILFQLEIIALARKRHDPARIMILINDVTDQKRLEDERRKSERWSAMAKVSAGMAHEIRNPLASISGSIEVLKESINLPDSESRLMDIVIRESDRLNNLINDFLQMSKPKPVECVMTDINRLIEDTVELIGNAMNSNCRMVTELADSAKAMVDPDQFLQLSWNLAKNALDAMPDGGELRISTRIIESENGEVDGISSESPEPPYVMIEFTDTGIGMAEDVIQQIFEPFATFKANGVGIGLAIVSRIIENHGGRIHVTSVLGEGTTVTVKIPVNHNG